MTQTGLFRRTRSGLMGPHLWGDHTGVKRLLAHDRDRLSVGDNCWFLNGHYPSQAGINRVLFWDAVQRACYLLRRGFRMKVCGGEPQWTPQGILKWNGTEGGPDSKAFGGMTNGHWILCLEGHELGFPWNTQRRRSAPDPLNSRYPSLNKATQHIAHHSDLLWITNDKAFVLRDSDSVSLGWGCLSKGLPGSFYLQPGFLCIPLALWLWGPSGADRDNKGMSWRHSLGRGLECSEHPKVPHNKSEHQTLITQIPLSSSVDCVSQQVCHFYKAELKEGPVLTSHSWHSPASLVIPDSRFSLRACWIELSAHWLGSFPSSRKQPNYTYTELELGAGGGVTPLA